MSTEVPRMVRLPRYEDDRGAIVVAELGEALPFVMVRWFAVLDVPSEAVRGEHLNVENDELLCALAGRVTVDTTSVHGDDESFVLDDPGRALHLPPGTWARQRDFATGTVLLVACSHRYDPGLQRRERPARPS